MSLISSQINIILLGVQAVGKTNLILSYFDGDFMANSIATIGVYLRTKNYRFEGENVKINFVDTAGQEKYYAITNNYLRNVNGVILVYALNERESFEKINYWIDKLNEALGEYSLVLVGNKCDLFEQRVVSKEEGEKKAKELHCKYYETSAKNNINVKEVFNEIAFVTYKDYKEKNNSKLDLDDDAIDGIKLKSKGWKNSKNKGDKKLNCCNKE